MRVKKSVTAKEETWADIAELARANFRSPIGEARVALEVYVHLAKNYPEMLREAMADAPTS